MKDSRIFDPSYSDDAAPRQWDESGWPFRMAFTVGTITLLCNMALGSPVDGLWAFGISAIAALLTAIYAPYLLYRRLRSQTKTQVAEGATKGVCERCGK